LFARKQIVDLEDIIANIQSRDLMDTTREESPLRKAQDAHEIDTTYITVEEQVDCIMNIAVGTMIELEYRIADV
jgi:cytidylate kinase